MAGTNLTVQDFCDKLALPSRFTKRKRQHPPQREHGVHQRQADRVGKKKNCILFAIKKNLEGNREISCSNTKKEEKELPPSPERTATGGTTTASGNETGCGKKIPKNTMKRASTRNRKTSRRGTPCSVQQTVEKIARKEGFQSPIENGQLMKNKPRLDDSSDRVIPCGVFLQNLPTTRRSEPDQAKREEGVTNTHSLFSSMHLRLKNETRCSRVVGRESQTSQLLLGTREQMATMSQLNRCKDNMDFRIPGLPHSVVKHAQSTSVRDTLFNKIYDKIKRITHLAQNQRK